MVHTFLSHIASSLIPALSILSPYQTFLEAFELTSPHLWSDLDRFMLRTKL